MFTYTPASTPIEWEVRGSTDMHPLAAIDDDNHMPHVDEAHTPINKKHERAVYKVAMEKEGKGKIK